MNWGDFRTDVKRWAEYVGQPWASTNGDWDTVIGRGVREYSQKTLCLFSDNQALGATNWQYGTPPIYDLKDGGLYAADSQGYKRLVFLPVNVVVGDRVLRNLKGQPGPVSVAEMQQLDPYGEAAVAAGSIQHWCMTPSRVIRLFPGPTGAVTETGVIPGYYEQPTLTNDLHNLMFDETDTRVAAMYCAALGLEQRAEGSSLAKVRAMDAKAAEHMVARARQARALVGEIFGLDYVDALMGKDMEEDGE